MIFLAIFEPTLIPFFVNVLRPESLLLGVLLDGPEDGQFGWACRLTQVVK